MINIINYFHKKKENKIKKCCVNIHRYEIIINLIKKIQ